jgi:hypothetical protein
MSRFLTNGTLRRWAFLPVLLVLAVAGGLAMRAHTGSQASEAGAETSVAEDQTSKTGDPVLAAEPVSSAARFNGPNPSGEQRGQLLETVGTLTAAHCYETYLNIGFVADGKAKGIYTDDEASKFLDLVFSLLDSVDHKLVVVSKFELGTEDRASLQQMRDVSNVLFRQANQLRTFWRSGKDEDAAKYEEIRKDSWTAIRKFTGVDRQNETAGK